MAHPYMAVPRRPPTRIVLNQLELSRAFRIAPLNSHYPTTATTHNPATSTPFNPTAAHTNNLPRSTPRLYIDLTHILTTYPPVARIYSVLETRIATPIGLPQQWGYLLDQIAKVPRVGDSWRKDIWCAIWVVVEDAVKTHQVEVRVPAHGGLEDGDGGDGRRGQSRLFVVPMFMSELQWLREVFGPVASEAMGLESGVVAPVSTGTAVWGRGGARGRGGQPGRAWALRGRRNIPR